MPIENRELVTTSNISEEVTRLLPAKTIDFADEPGSRNLRVRKAIQRLTKDRSIGRKEPFPSPHDVGRLVIVEPRARSRRFSGLARGSTITRRPTSCGLGDGSVRPMGRSLVSLWMGLRTGRWRE